MKKIILSIAIITMFPFAIMADDNLSYATAEITNADRQHIASTAYVKGAYNDAITAVNAVSSALDDTQNRLMTAANGSVDGVLDSNNVYDTLKLIHYYGNDSTLLNGWDEKLITAKGVITGIRNHGVRVYTTWGNDDRVMDITLENLIDISDIER